MSILDTDDFPVAVAIDFGTTFSGCAYVCIPHDKEPKLISEWPNQRMSYAKAPTISLYKKTKEGYEMSAWGSSVKYERELLRSECMHLYKFKPHLDENTELPPWNRPIPVHDAIADYLKGFHEYTARQIEQQLGGRWTRENFRYYLTVPAMWSDKAKHIMRWAAIRANLINEDDHPDRLVLVSEPEAAALHCERTCKEYNLKHGDRFLICDAGGGTVDLIVYNVTDSPNGQTLSEVTKGHGATCGSMLIDLNFGNLLIDKLGKQGVKLRDHVIPSLVETFAYSLKPNFDGTNDIHLPLPYDPFCTPIKDFDALDIDDGVMCFNAADMRKIVFDPVVEKVLQLIQDQIFKAKTVSAIFLVGGFGSSTYLLERVKQAFGKEVKIISTPYRPEIAVVFGAAYTAMSPKKVTARAIRRCYGVGVYTDFVTGIDPPHLKGSKLGRSVCYDRFSTFVKQGQLVNVDECIARRHFFENEGDLNPDDGYEIAVYAVDGDPPRHVTGLAKLAYISIPNPFKPTDPLGLEVEFTVRFYFGLSEIKVEAVVQGKLYVTRLEFDGDSRTKDRKQILFHQKREN
ncbi:Heat shock 70 kDa protein 12A [Actinomortierella ambigua]|uniref:Heat shock 70 kDa protein 12A n=1 Tax=Actinomortierella ambigua TaxID=1343610 RepID=A0A9P6U3P1_9FUNG|nr:Heat shock 70 kDa protein 12A [Actinomortierella ambigua]